MESLAPELDVKQLELLRACLPNARRMAVLSNPLDKGSVLHYQWSEPAARALQLELQPASLSRFADLDSTMASIAAMRADGLLLFTDPLIGNSLPAIAARAVELRLPSFGEFRQFAESGGMVSHGPSLEEMVRSAVRYVDRIFKGAKAGDLPMERPTRFETVINRKTAIASGVALPSSVLLRADEIID